MFPVAQVGPLAVQVPGLILLAGLWLGIHFSERKLESSKRNRRLNVGDLVFVSLLAGLIGARLGYLVRYPSAFAQSPGSIVSLNPDLLDPWIGTLAATAAAIVYGQRKKLQLLPTFDALTPLFAAFTVSLYSSQLASGANYGLPTNLPWAINLLGASRHPTQVYDALAALAILAFIWYAPNWKQPGERFFVFLSLAAGARLLLDAFDAASPLLTNGWRLSQVAAWLIMAAGLLFLRRLHLPQH